MFWKNLGLNKKIVLFTATLLTIVFAMSVIYIAKLNATADEVHRLGTANDLSAVMLRREIDHLLWVNTLQGFVFDAATACGCSSLHPGGLPANPAQAQRTNTRPAPFQG